jgi:hypothetical protein
VRSVLGMAGFSKFLMVITETSHFMCQRQICPARMPVRTQRWPCFPENAEDNSAKDMSP